MREARPTLAFRATKNPTDNGWVFVKWWWNSEPNPRPQSAQDSNTLALRARFRRFWKGGLPSSVFRYYVSTQPVCVKKPSLSPLLSSKCDALKRIMRLLTNDNNADTVRKIMLICRQRQDYVRYPDFRNDSIAA
jgi:hypothetical protein